MEREGNCQLPDTIVLSIFIQLNRLDLISASSLCRQWFRVSRDEILWKRLFYLDFKLDPKVTALRNQTTYYCEYRRIVDETPQILSQTLIDHKDEVSHVTFSHDGTMFSTVSKDCTLKVWSTHHPCQLKFDINLKTMCKWKFAFISQFKADDRMLFVSGVQDGQHPDAEDIIVFEVTSDSLLPRCNFPNKPYNISGCWFNRTALMSGEFHLLKGYTLCSAIRLCKVENRRSSPRQFKFVNFDAASIRLVLTSNCIPGIMRFSEQKDKPTSSFCISKSNDIDSKLLIFPTSTRVYPLHIINFKLVKLDMSDFATVWSKNSRSPQMNKRGCYSGTSSHAGANFDIEYLKANFDFPDHLMDMEGHILGMSLTADEKYLLVNVRPWSNKSEARYCLFNPPPMTTMIELKVVELETFSILPKVYSGHKFFSHVWRNSYRLIMDFFIDSCDDFISSGSYDRFAYVWDRTFNLPPVRLSHNNNVKCVAINPKNSEMLVSTDFHSVKIWRSKKMARFFKDYL